MVYECSRDEVRGSQEQIQIIATAIGKPVMKAPAMAKVSANSGFASGRTLPGDIAYSIASRSRYRDEAVTASSSRKRIPTARSDAPRIWLTEG
jgi:hypothetical protein